MACDPSYHDMQVDQPPPEKKPKLYNDVATATPTLSAREEVGGVKGAEDEDALPAIKSSHLDLDDIPMELLPTHQGKIMKQVCTPIDTTLPADYTDTLCVYTYYVYI